MLLQFPKSNYVLHSNLLNSFANKTIAIIKTYLSGANLQRNITHFYIEHNSMFAYFVSQRAAMLVNVFFEQFLELHSSILFESPYLHK